MRGVAPRGLVGGGQVLERVSPVVVVVVVVAGTTCRMVVVMVVVVKGRCYESPKQEKVSHAFKHLMQNLKAYNGVGV